MKKQLIGNKLEVGRPKSEEKKQTVMNFKFENLIISKRQWNMKGMQIISLEARKFLCLGSITDYLQLI